MIRKLRGVLERLIGSRSTVIKNRDHEPFALKDLTNKSVRRINQKRSFSPMLLPPNTILTWKEPLDKKSAANSKTACLSLLFGFEQDGKLHTITLKRPMDEEFVFTTGKIQGKLMQSISPPSTKGARSELPSNERNLAIRANIGTTEKLFGEVMEQSDTISIGSVEYRICKEPVDISFLTAALVPLVGCPLYPSIDYRSGVPPHSPPVLHWFVRDVEVETDSPSKPKKKNIVEPPPTIHIVDEEKRTFALPDCMFRHSGASYVPTVEDVGKRIVLVADLGADFIVRCGLSKHVVQSQPEHLLCDERIDWCRRAVEPDCLRLVSFNILAALYLNLSLPQEQLFFPYCPKEYQQYEYRYPLLLREIQGYAADVYFLQEVDQRMQLRYLTPLFQSMDMTMLFEKKGAEVNEGTAIAFSNKRFSVISSGSHWISALLDDQMNEDVRSILETSEESMTVFRSRPTIVQIAVLRDVVSNEVVVCANTHLHHNPLHEHIKVVQALLAGRKIEQVVASLSGEKRVRVLFGGDFNSTPDGPVYELFSTGKLSKSNVCWKLDAGLVPSDLQLLPAGGALTNLTGTPPYTNYTAYISDGAGVGFAGTLDYIWANGFETRRQAPEVTHNDVIKYGALPSKISPSDHIPLIVDVALTE